MTRKLLKVKTFIVYESVLDGQLNRIESYGREGH